MGNQDKGIVLTQQSLVLQKVDRLSSGEYECQAFNSEGYSTSNPVKLNIMCKWNPPGHNAGNLTYRNQPIILISTARRADHILLYLARIFYDHFVNKFYNLI